jgi:hypothetical protein
VNLLTGNQGGGKTFAAMNEIITISYMPESHLIVYIAKKSYDPTFQEIRKLSNVPIIEVGYGRPKSFVVKYLWRKACTMKPGRNPKGVA